MVNKKGRMKYCPPSVIDEIEDIKREDELFGDSEAFRKMVKYARVGREAQRMIKLDWSKSKSLPRVESYPSKKRRSNNNFFGGRL